MSIAAILKVKGSDVVRVGPETPVRVVIQTMGDRRIGAVLIMNKAAQLLGIVSERDIVHALARQGPSAMELSASALMSEVRWTVTPAGSIADAMRIMTNHRVRHLPVLEDGVLVGLVSIGDIVKARLDRQAHEVESLRAHVGGMH